MSVNVVVACGGPVAGNAAHALHELVGAATAPRQLLLDLRDCLYAHQAEVIAKRVGRRPDDDGAESQA